MTPQPTQKMIFVNLPVQDLQRSMAFYEGIGAKRDARFCGPESGCMVLSETIVVMLLTHRHFSQFTKKQIGDPRTTAQVLLSLSQESRAAVDAIVQNAAALGGRVDTGGVHDEGFMYGRDFEDLDGHGWGVLWMDMAAFEAAQKGQTAA